MARPRPDAARGRPPLAPRRRGLRGIQPADGPDGNGREADNQHDPTRPDVALTARPARAVARGTALPVAEPEALPPAVQAHDHELGRFPGRVVRDRRSQGNEVRQRDHRDVHGTTNAGIGVRAPAPLHGRDRRRVPCVGIRARWNGRNLRGHRKCRPLIRRRGQARGRSVTRTDERRTGDGCRACQRR